MINLLQEWAQRNNITLQAMAELSRLYEPDFIAIQGGSEAMLQATLRVEAAKIPGCALWRNNSGAHLDDTGRMVRYGLANDSKKLNEVFKSSDLIGVTRGVFTAVECKEPGWNGPRNDRERAQANFGRTVESLGGIFLFATCLDDYLKRVRI